MVYRSTWSALSGGGLPPIASGVTADPIRSKAGQTIVADSGFAVALCAQAAGASSRGLGRRLRRGSGSRRGRLCARYSRARHRPRRTSGSILGVDPTRELPLNALDDIVLVSVGVAMEARERIEHDVDVARSL